MLLLLNFVLQQYFYSCSGYVCNLIKPSLFQSINHKTIFNQKGIPQTDIRPPVVWTVCAGILSCDFLLINRNIYELAM